MHLSRFCPHSYLMPWINGWTLLTGQPITISGYKKDSYGQPVIRSCWFDGFLMTYGLFLLARIPSSLALSHEAFPGLFGQGSIYRRFWPHPWLGPETKWPPLLSTTFSNAFSCMKNDIFQCNFHWTDKGPPNNNTTTAQIMTYVWQADLAYWCIDICVT